MTAASGRAPCGLPRRGCSTGRPVSGLPPPAGHVTAIATCQFDRRDGVIVAATRGRRDPFRLARNRGTQDRPLPMVSMVPGAMVLAPLPCRVPRPDPRNKAVKCPPGAPQARCLCRRGRKTRIIPNECVWSRPGPVPFPGRDSRAAVTGRAPAARGTLSPLFFQFSPPFKGITLPSVTAVVAESARMPFPKM